MPIVLTSGPTGFGYPLLPPDGGQTPVRGSNQDPAQEPAPAPQGARAESETASPTATARPTEPGAESQKQESASHQFDKKNGQDTKSGRETKTGPDGSPLFGLTPQEEAAVRQLKARDREVRTHEQAHVAAGGQHAGGASYSYEMGPDGKRYAVGGEVPIDTSQASTPEATIQKARTVRKAALAPAKPSSADKQVASKATAMEQEARQQVQEENREQAELAAHDQAQSAGITNLSSAVPSKLPKAPPFEVRMNPLSKTV